MMLISLSLTALKPLNKLTDDSLYIAHEIIFLMTYNCSPRSAEAFCSCMVFVNRNPWEFVTSTASGMLISTAKSPVVRVSKSRGFFWRSAHVNLVEPVLAMISRPLLNPMPFRGKFVWFQERKTSEVSSFSSYSMIDNTDIYTGIFLTKKVQQMEMLVGKPKAHSLMMPGKSMVLISGIAASKTFLVWTGIYFSPRPRSQIS